MADLRQTAYRIAVAGKEAVGQLLSDGLSWLAAFLGDQQFELGQEPAEIHGWVTPANSVEIHDPANGVALEEYLRRGEIPVTQHLSGSIAVVAAEAIHHEPNLFSGSRPDLSHQVQLTV
jgi:hypothetical protein